MSRHVLYPQDSQSICLFFCVSFFIFVNISSYFSSDASKTLIFLFVYFLMKSLRSSCLNAFMRFFNRSSGLKATFHGLSGFFLPNPFFSSHTLSICILFMANNTSSVCFSSCVAVPYRHPLLQFNASTINGSSLFLSILSLYSSKYSYTSLSPSI